MPTNIIREFPLPRIQTGAVLGNGETGLLVWGNDHTLNITMGNASLWDHRGGCEWNRKQELALLTEALKRKDMDAIQAMFASDNPDGVRRATLIPLGRLVLTLPENMTLQTVKTNFLSGVVTVCGTGGLSISMAIAMDRQDFALAGVPEEVQVSVTDAWTLSLERAAIDQKAENTLKGRGFTPPERFDNGFLQPFPVDPSVAVVTERKVTEVHCAIRRDVPNAAEAKKICFASYDEVKKQSEQYYGNFMKRIPGISLPDSPLLEEIYAEWAYRYAATTNPKGIAPGLQGGFLEDDRLAPWSGDYHFNINVQMINSPGLKLNAPENIRKIFDLLLSWKEKMHYNADCFVREPEGIMLSHAVDDRGKSMGGFWTGNIDHACSAWMAKLMVEYCDIYNDMEFLKNQVYDFMLGVMLVYKKLLDRRDGKLYLPITISPEFRGSQIDAWGVNASFQLAALHNLTQNLIRVSRLLGKEIDPLWIEIEETLPVCSTWSLPGKEPEIALWEGQPLRESHRHHSHLGAIFPFKTMDPLSPENRKLIDRSMTSWTDSGMGGWTGWCMSWASVLRTRCGYPQMAAYLLEIWHNLFRNEGGGSLHDAFYKGFTVFANTFGLSEVMQLDGGMGALFAISELFVHEFQGELRCFFGIPKLWKHAEIKDLRTAGGFILSGTYERGRLICLKVRATRDNVLKIRLPEASELFGNSDTVERVMKTNEEIIFQ